MNLLNQKFPRYRFKSIYLLLILIWILIIGYVLLTPLAVLNKTLILLLLGILILISLIALFFEYRETILQQKWKQISQRNPECLNYLEYINYYPMWRLCYFFAILGSSLLTLTLGLLLQSSFKGSMINTLILFFVFSTVVLTLLLIKMIDYFRWHILCQGFGCKKYKKK